MTIFKRILSSVAALAISFAALAADDVEVSIVNFYPGPDVYELEGHTALRVKSPDYDVAVSYGTYDFNSPNFIYRFVKGETDYRVVAYPWQPFADAYIRQGRRIVAHPVALDSAQTARFLILVDDNLRPENAVYRYNYVKDNCATRPLAIVERALGDSIVLEGSPKSGMTTFREAMRRYHANYPWYQFGIDLALGSGIDYPITLREATFAPATLDSVIASATVGGRPVTRQTIVINDVAPDAAIEGPTPWYLTPLAVFTLLFIITVALTVRDICRRRVSRWFDSLLFGAFGLAGCLIAFLVFISVHEATSPNYLLVWLNPFCLIPAIFIWLKKAKTAVLSYQIVNFVVLVGLAAAWPLLPQSANIAFLPLLLCDMLRSASYVYITVKNKRQK
ncbi:MAG: DUF4105 domain-containing protein [Muribaculaceae bacterium]